MMDTDGCYVEDDISLMRRVRDADDGEAFALLAGRYRGPLRRFFASLLPANSPADDHAQETLLRLWLTRHRYREDGNFAAYLFQLARHYGLNQKTRYQYRARHETAPPEGETPQAPHYQPENVLMERLERRRRRAAIARLPPIYRSVFEMSQFGDYTYAEIAERLQIPVGTVKSRMAEAVRRLRLLLTEENDETNK